ncbi:kinase-like protein [Saitoella complicata NRRL Y-17804]|nr:kinase-like protein [Saitoella complicata NRRL Y-17804]ODQ52453.1 kinase-like protein [Saitoella complicata NRRL Y-17804]
MSNNITEIDPAIKSGTVLKDGRYIIKSTLNRGSYGTVVLARDRTLPAPNNLVAIKCLVKDLANLSQAERDSALDDDELYIHRILERDPNESPHIVKLLDTFNTETHLFLVVEFCPLGDLYENITSGRCPKDTESVRDLLLQLVDAVAYSHAHGVYHRDVKPENILLMPSSESASGVTLKLGDWGLATQETTSADTGTGSDRYMAPEQFDPAVTEVEPRACDVWAVGVCALNILFSRNPFKEPTSRDPVFRDWCCDGMSLFDVFPTMSEDTYRVLSHSLCLDPKKRDLEKVREAIESVVAWTNDDEVAEVEETSWEEVGVNGPTANRAPLRTPSLAQTIAASQQTSFPWAKALEASAAPAPALTTTTTVHHGFYSSSPSSKVAGGLINTVVEESPEEEQLETDEASSRSTSGETSTTNTTASFDLCLSPEKGRLAQMRSKERKNAKGRAVGGGLASVDSGFGGSFAGLGAGLSSINIKPKPSRIQQLREQAPHNLGPRSGQPPAGANGNGLGTDSRSSSRSSSRTAKDNKLVAGCSVPTFVKGSKDHLKFGKSWSDWVMEDEEEEVSGTSGTGATPRKSMQSGSGRRWSSAGSDGGLRFDDEDDDEYFLIAPTWDD